MPMRATSLQVSLLFCTALVAFGQAPKWVELHAQSHSPYGSVDPPIPTIRYSHAAVMWRDSMIITHGYFYDRREMNPNWRSDTWKLDMSGKKASWAKLWPPADNPSPNEGVENPFGRYGHTATVYQDAMYIYGGTDGGARYHGSSQGYQQGHEFDDCWKFDLVKNQWIQLQKKGEWPGQRHLHVAALVGDTMYVHGGMGYKDTWGYHIPSDTWTQIHTDPRRQPGVRYGHMAAAVSTGFYIYGGRRTTAEGGHLLGDLWFFSPAEQSWTEVLPATGDVPGPRMYAFMAALGDEELVVVAGSTGTPAIKCSAEVWTFGIKDGVWERTRKTPYANYHHTVVAKNESVVMFGGHSCERLSSGSPGYFNRVMELDLGARATRETPLEKDEL